jgi:WD40 repeat protein
VVRFDEEKAICLRSISFLSSVQFFKTCLDKIFCVYPKGIFEVFTVHDDGNLYCSDGIESNDHEDNIVSLDFDEKRRMIMTAALDQRVKMWTFNKQLLLQITSNEPIDSAIFGNGLDVLLAQSKKLSLLQIRQFDLSVNEIE